MLTPTPPPAASKRPVPPPSAHEKASGQSSIRLPAAAQPKDALVEVGSLPQGGAKAIVQYRKHAPESVHDVEFYEKVAEELPDSTILHSILYTHKSMVDDGTSLDHEISELHHKVGEWAAAHRANLKEKFTHQRENLALSVQAEEQTEEEMEKERKEVLSRIHNATTLLEGKLADLSHLENEELERLRRQNEEAHQLRLKRIEEATRAQKEADQISFESKQLLNFEADRTRFEMKSTFEIQLLVSEAERSRVQLLLAMADDKQIVRLFEERREWYQDLCVEERKEFEDLKIWIETTHDRYRRQARVRSIHDSLRLNLQAAEEGGRHNVAAAEGTEIAQMMARWLQLQQCATSGVPPESLEPSPSFVQSDS
jgi:hypothetical protein